MADLQVVTLSVLVSGSSREHPEKGVGAMSRLLDLCRDHPDVIAADGKLDDLSDQDRKTFKSFLHEPGQTTTCGYCGEKITTPSRPGTIYGVQVPVIIDLDEHDRAVREHYTEKHPGEQYVRML